MPPYPRAFWQHYMSQPRSYVSKITNILCIVISLTHELLHLLDVGRLWPCSDRSNLVRISIHSAILNNIPQVFHTTTTKFTFLAFSHKLLLMQVLKDLMQVLQVFIDILAEDKYIVEVHHNALI